MTLECLEKANKLHKKIEDSKSMINELDNLKDEKCTIVIKKSDSCFNIEIPKELRNTIIDNMRSFFERRKEIAIADFNML